MARPTILIDIDNTIAQTQQAYVAYANTLSPTPFIFETITREYADDMDDPFEALVRGFITSTDYANTVEAIAPYPGILKAFQDLYGAGFRLCVASSRIENWHQPTAQWLETHGLLPYVDSLFLRTQDIDSADFKRAVAELAGVHYAFDDSAHTSSLLPFVKAFYLIEQPWNRDASALEHVVRVKDFETGVRQLLGAAQPSLR